MLARGRRPMGAVALAALAAAAPAVVRASGDAGLEIAVGRFRLQAFYRVASEYSDGADRAAADPRVALFTIAATLQANAAAFAAIPHTLRFDLLVRDGSADTVLGVIEDPEANATRPTTVVLESPLERDVAGEIVAATCGRYPGACRRPAGVTVDLYRCAGPRCDGRIRFGAFPSADRSDRFALEAPAPGAARIRVDREQMARWFDPLDPRAPRSPSTARDWYFPARASISRVARGVCAGCAGARDEAACGDFSLSPEQIRLLLARARTLTREQATREFERAPCVVRGVARWDGLEVGFEISALLVATLRFPDGSGLLLGCDGACDAAVARAAPRAPGTRPAGARAPARRPER